MFFRTIFFFAFFSVFLTGCRPTNPGTPGPLGLPPENKVRLLSDKITHTPDKIQYKWTLIGERNWSQATNSGGQMRLEKTIPLNTPSMKNACNIWESDLTVEKVSNGWKWRTRLHGTVGTTVLDEGTLSSQEPLERLVQITYTRNGLEKLPATLPLARVGSTEFTLLIAR